jgi:hypothetical protein
MVDGRASARPEVSPVSEHDWTDVGDPAGTQASPQTDENPLLTGARAPRRSTRSPSRARTRREPTESATRPVKQPTKQAVKEPTREDKLNGVFQLVATPLLIAGSQKRELLADGAAFLYYGKGISAAAAQTAEEQAEFAALLDKALKFGPYGLLLAAVIPLPLQIITNHRPELHNITQHFGILSPSVLIASVIAQAPDGSVPTMDGGQGGSTSNGDSSPTG